MRQHQQHRIVDQIARVVADWHIASLADFSFGHVTGREILDQSCGVRPADFDLPLRRDIPHRHTARQAVVFRRGVTKMRWDEHVIVDRKGFDTIGHGRVKIARFTVVWTDANTECH